MFDGVLQPTLLNRVQSGNELAEKLLVSQLPSATNTGQNNTSSSSSVKPTHQASKPPTADITSMSLASLFENTESGQFGLGFGSGGLLGLRGAMPKMPSFRVCWCSCSSVGVIAWNIVAVLAQCFSFYCNNMAMVNVDDSSLEADLLP